MANNGKDYELFVANLHQALLNAEHVTTQKNILIEVNKKLVDSWGIERQFDIYWEYELAGYIYKTVIECKDYNSNVSVEKIDALIGKVRDIPGLKAVFATKMGYQSGAKIKAENNGIDLLIVREQNDSDWVDIDGTPFIKTIVVNTHIVSPAQIQEFLPFIDTAWVEQNTDIDISQPLGFSVPNDQIFIDDIKTDQKYSLYELANKLSPIGDNEIGIFEIEQKFENAFICYESLRLKLLAYKIKYLISEPQKNSYEIDFSKELVGVVEYLQKGTKKSIFKNGLIK